MTDPSQATHVAAPATFAAGSLWWFVETLREFGPSWAMVPPLLFGLAAVANAWTNHLTASQQRRHAEANRLRLISLAADDRSTLNRHAEEDRRPAPASLEMTS